ncbi:response regulator [uncultured Sphingomonas sp.]|uniref:response regulator transcription factor n=1 Tax=uncultured Sphingomonas sp. TaxID=158754 RepID=UPI0025E7551F|nr:response regulator [uncultured Sphingomonas sp.]
MEQAAQEEEPSGSGLIAIVDDDPAVRAATSSLLRSHDYRCSTFASAEELLGEDIRAFGCILSDIQMPGMSGIDLAQRVRASDHPVPLILMSAYLNERAASLYALGYVTRLLEKPLDASLLASAVQDALASRSR